MLTHATIIPLIGGMTLGVERAFGVKPKYLASFPDFRKNDAHAKLNFNVPFLDLDTPYWLEYIGKAENAVDVVSTVCPCAGLSITSSHSANHGAKSTHNKWMYKTAEITLGRIKPKVMFGENAPALFGIKGEPVAHRLAEIGRKHGYSFSMVFTDTKLHGIPQKRPRTFYFFWKSARAPKFIPMARSEVSFTEFIRNVEYPKNPTVELIEFSKCPLKEDIFYQYAYDRWGDAWRAEVEGRTILDQVRRLGQLKAMFHWANANAVNHPQYHEIQRMQDLTKADRGLWDESPKVIDKTAPAIMFKNTKRLVHPYEDRFLNVRELTALMGLPPSFQFYYDEKSEDDRALANAMHHLSQNVPVTTAADMATYIKRVINREIALSDSPFYMFDNTRKMRVLKPVTSRADDELEDDDDVTLDDDD